MLRKKVNFIFLIYNTSKSFARNPNPSPVMVIFVWVRLFCVKSLEENLTPFYPLNVQISAVEFLPTEKCKCFKISGLHKSKSCSHLIESFTIS